jgi:transmembrane sensor
MNEPSALSPEQRRISHAASAWLVKRDRGLTAAEQDDFFAWLAADPRHGEWFARHQATWKEFNLLAQWRPEHSAEPNPELLARPRRRRVAWPVWTMALAAAAAVALAFLLSRPPAGEAPAAPVAAVYRSRVLEDGSTIGLRGDSEVLVRYTATERKVDLVRGEAFFTVAKNPDRPFVVHAHGVDVRAVGTAFNVRVDPAHVEVLVTEGRVAVDQAVAGASGEGAGIEAREQAASPSAGLVPLLLDAGERAIVSLAGETVPAVSAVPPAEIARALAWQPALLDFESAPLGEVVAEFNRRNHTQLVVADAGLRDMPIVASFRSDNVEGFVRLLELTAGVRVERRDGTIILRAGGAAP